jgi:hypothetical protein
MTLAQIISYITGDIFFRNLRILEVLLSYLGTVWIVHNIPVYVHAIVHLKQIPTDEHVNASASLDSLSDIIFLYFLYVFVKILVSLVVEN